MNYDRTNHALEIKSALSDPTRVLDALGILGEGRARQRQAAGWLIRCPVHMDSTPSCSVQTRDGVILWKCWGCDASGDVLALIAAARGLRTDGPDFRAVLAEGARMAGLWGILDALEGRESSTERPSAAPRLPQESFSEPELVRVYPEGVEAFWEAMRPVSEDNGVSFYLANRGIDPERVEACDLARVLPERGAMPPWARCRGGTWREASYRLIVPMWDAEGGLRSVRAWRVGGDPELPKRLPPSGCKASELVMADEWGLAMLRGQRAPERAVIAEGEPDTLTWMTRLNEPGTATIGIISGSWHAELADRFPIGTQVIVRTDQDVAGDRYYDQIRNGLKRRCFVSRSKEAES